jgi:P-type conjugative transfer protein TrbG
VIYHLLAAPGRVSDLILQPGEVITSIAAGDTARWTIGDTSSGSGEAKRVHVLVKPFSAGLSTNLVIATDRRTYHLQLSSTVGTAMAGISWSYPADELLAVKRKEAEAQAVKPVAAGLDVQSLTFSYAITGDTPAWRPLRAFDDGRQTFIEFPASIAVGEAPPLFVLGDKGPQSWSIIACPAAIMWWIGSSTRPSSDSVANSRRWSASPAGRLLRRNVAAIGGRHERDPESHPARRSSSTGGASSLAGYRRGCPRSRHCAHSYARACWGSPGCTRTHSCARASTCSRSPSRSHASA